MRRIQSLFKTLLMLIPMTAVPVMAIFGIPEFFPVSASMPQGLAEASRTQGRVELRAGQSDALLVRQLSTSRRPTIDLFQPYEAEQGRSAGVVANAASNDLTQRRLNWKDPLADPEPTHEVTLRSNVNSRERRRTTAPSGSLQGSVSSQSLHERSSRARQSSATASSASAPSFSGQAAVPPGSTSVSEDRFQSVKSPSRPDQSVRAEAVVAESALSVNDVRPRRASQRTLSWQQAVNRLNELGIRTFRLTPDSGENGYRFVCLVTSVDDPRISRRFEAESLDPLGAVGDVLAQVEDWNLHR